MARRCLRPCTARFTRAIRASFRRRTGRCCYRPSRRRTWARSPPVTSVSRARRRVRLLGFFSKRWLRNALRRRMRPLPVTLKRLAAPRWVFILGISALLLLGGCALVGRGALGRGPGPLVWGQHHHHVSPVELGRGFDLRPGRQVI